MSRILLVDDNESFLIPLGKALRRAGYEVETAPEGTIALRLFHQSPFDLVITDLIMPGKEGISTIIELRRLQPGIKIIAISGGGLLDSGIPLGFAQQLGALKTLAKPFTISEILQAISHSLSTATEGRPAAA